MLDIQTFLIHQNLDRLKHLYDINANRHNKYPNLISFKYGIHSDMNIKMCRECRGIILDENNDWAIVARGYDKFFNMEEGHAAKIDWNTAEVFEKLDGSLCLMYFYDNQWHVGTSGTADANGNVHNNNDKTFKQLFWHIYDKMGYKLPPECFRHVCFIFELCSMENRIVVVYDNSKLILHGARNLLNQDELTPHDFSQLFKTIAFYDLSSIDQVVNSLPNLDSLKNEGYVVCDAQFNRIKIKSPKYVLIAHLKDGVSDKRLLDLIRIGESGEFLSYFPEFRPKFDIIREKYEKLTDNIIESYKKIGNIKEQKEFALEALKTPFSSVLFTMRKHGDKISEILNKVNIDKLFELIGLINISQAKL